MNMSVEKAYGKPDFKYMVMPGLSPVKDYFLANTLEEAKEKARKFIGTEHCGDTVSVVDIYDIVEGRQSIVGLNPIGYLTREILVIMDVGDGEIAEMQGSMREFLHVGWFLTSYENLDECKEED